jgi:tetratricopeptide (TPR) repeat protein
MPSTLKNSLLTASMIVFNEEHCLAECLESIKGIVDEIIVVDTGSTDRSKAIAEFFDAKVLDFPWRGGFAAARNESLRHAAGEWILYIDADERVQAIERPEVEDFLADRSKVAFTVRFRPYKGFTAYREYRLFRNDPRIRFEGVIHETIIPSVQTVSGEDSLSIGHCNLTIEHRGYEGSQDHKHARNLPLLRRQLAKDPHHVYCWWHLGWVLNGLGDEAGAETAWVTATKVIRERDAHDMADSLPYADLVRLWHKQGKDVTGLLQEALERFPDQYLLIWIKAQVLMAERKLDEAIPLFERLAAIDPENLNPARLAYDARIFGVLSYEPLASCYFKMGRFAEAAAYYALAEQCEPENVQHKIKRQLTLARMRP